MTDSEPGRPIRIVAADDSREFLAGLTAWIASHPPLRLAGTAADGREALALVERLRPDLVLMDAVMPALDGYAATRLLKSGPRPPRVVILTLHESSAARLEARSAGADEFVGKSELAERLFGVIETLFPEGGGRDVAGRAEPRPPVARPSKGGPPESRGAD